MKKTKINLLTNRENYHQIERFFVFFRMLFFAQMIFLFFLFLIFFIVITSQNNQINNLFTQRKTYFETLKNKENLETKLAYLQNKYQAIENYLKEDAHSLPYYNLLNSALLKSTESASLKSFLISKNRDVDFTVTFTQFNNLLNFFRFIESDQFLKNFENVSLKKFNALGESKASENYELVFTGKFIKINEKNN